MSKEARLSRRRPRPWGFRTNADNWLKAEAAGRLREVAGKAISAEQMEIARLKAELAKARMERDILKKAAVHSRESCGEIRLYPATSKAWPVAAQCRVLGVSASGYRQYRARQTDIGPLQPGRRLGDVALLVHIKAVFNEMKSAYGWPRIWRELQARGIRAGKERVRNL